MLGVKTKKRYGQLVHEALARYKYLLPGYIPFRDDTHVIFPIKPMLAMHDLRQALSSVTEWELVEHVFKQSSREHSSLRDLVRNDIPQALLEYLPSSFDQIGDVIIIDFHPSLEGYEPVIGQALLRLVRKAKAVYKKTSGVHGLTRVRNLSLVAGEDHDWTLHKEYGLSLWVKFKHVYFSPRLSEEHKRVAAQVHDEETVIDLFTGVGGFPLHIAKQKNTMVYAIDINPHAIESLTRSLHANSLRGSVIPVNADAKTWALKHPKNIADHVIMNHPSSAHEFLYPAVHLLKPNGIIHFYTFAEISRWKNHALEIFKQALSSLPFPVNIRTVRQVRKIRQYSPSQHHVCIETQLNKES